MSNTKRKTYAVVRLNITVCLEDVEVDVEQLRKADELILATSGAEQEQILIDALNRKYPGLFVESDDDADDPNELKVLEWDYSDNG